MLKLHGVADEIRKFLKSEKPEECEDDRDGNLMIAQHESPKKEQKKE